MKNNEIAIDMAGGSWSGYGIPDEEELVLGVNAYYSTCSEKTGLNNNVCVVGGSGTGKTRGIVEPNLLRASGSYVVCDSKGILYNKYRDYLTERGYQVRLLDFTDPENKDSCHYNPLSYITNTAEINALARTLLWARNNDEAGSIDCFRKKAAESLLSAVIGYLRDYTESENLCIRNLDYLLNVDKPAAPDYDENDDDEYQHAGNEFLDRIFAEIETLDPDSYSVKQYREYRNGAGCCNNTVRGYVAAELSKIYLPEYTEFFEKDTINLCGIGKEKTAIFIKADIADAPSDKMIPVLFTQVFRILRREVAISPERKLTVPACMILDDYMTHYDVEDLQGMITSVNDSRISVIVLLKSEAQLESSYRVSARTVISNCDIYVYLGGSDLVTCKRISLRAQKPLADVLALPVGKGIVIRRGSDSEVVDIINPDEMRGLF